MAPHRPPTNNAAAAGEAARAEAIDEDIGADTKNEPGEGAGKGGRTGSGAAYKRASRKGAPRRFNCPFPGCEKVYSRAEHLQRHQLNHNPEKIYECDVHGCRQQFVRLDLLTRHKKRHSGSYIPRNRVPNFNTSPVEVDVRTRPPVISPTTTGPPALAPPQHPSPHLLSQQQPHHPPPHQQQHQHPQHPQQQQHQHNYPQRGPYDPSVLLTPSSTHSPQTTLPNPVPPRMPHGSTWTPSPINELPFSIMRSKPSYYAAEDPIPGPLPGPSSMVAYPEVPAFDEWLFDNRINYSEFSSVYNVPFFEGGLESTFNNNIHYDESQSLTSRSQPDPTPPRQMEELDHLLSEPRRQEILRMFQLFRNKYDKYESRIVDLVSEVGGDLPVLSLDMMRDCVQEYWESVSPRLPIIHKPTFSCNNSPMLLLMAVVALGAASLRGRDTGGHLRDYGAFADLIIEGARWEIVQAEEATPPVALWVAQALLLVEFYEKLYSWRRFHERAHIYHSATLTLLRRGSPLIGRAGSESPPEEAVPTASDHQSSSSSSGAGAGGAGGGSSGAALGSQTWWTRWAETESMHRVVFAAFMLDIIHAAMFGHAADMDPQEIRLPLPCDDNVWTAPSPEICRQMEGNLRIYGVKKVSFLDGLKSVLHGKEVMTHSFARMIIMSGLLSVGWHLSRRETHLKWLDVRGQAPKLDAQDNLRKMLLRAFDNWKASFDRADTNRGGGGVGSPVTIGPIGSAAMLYHLAHISLHVDIIDCQVYAGAKRLLGRKVSSRDHSNAVTRMKVWAKTGSTRHAILHAFKLLHGILVDARARKAHAGVSEYDSYSVPYSISDERDPHRPWIMYYATLSIWSFVRAVGARAGTGVRPPLAQTHHQHQHQHPMDRYRRMGAYLSSVERLEDIGEKAPAGLHEGLPELLETLREILGEAHSEILQEAHARLKVCKDMLAEASMS